MLDPLHPEIAPPERTTPQGTQAHGVERGHEPRDVQPRAVLLWLVGLLVAGAAIQLLLWGAIEAWRAATPVRVPSPILGERRPPPYPRVEPNPLDAPPPREPLGLPGPLRSLQVYLEERRRAEEQRLRELGLIDPRTGQPALPPDALQRAGLRVLPSPTARERRPSDASGGFAPTGGTP